jgi:hypothetical protein
MQDAWSAPAARVERASSRRVEVHRRVATSLGVRPAPIQWL